MYDLSLLKSFLDQSVYARYRSFVSEKEFDRELIPILHALDEWYQSNSESATLEDIANLTFAAGVRDKDQEYLKQVFKTLGTVNGQETAQKLLERFKTVRTCQDISVAAYEASRGSKSVLEVLSLADKLRDPSQHETTFVTDDLHDILDEVVKTRGLRWRLESLNRSLGSLRKGDFGFVFARPETGKTTFLASEVTHMASQLTEDAGPILWFNNEEQGKKVKLRCYQAALAATMAHLKKAPDRALAAYGKATNNKIRIYDSATIHRKQVEAICKAEAPSLIIFDQIDKIKGFTSDREDLVMGAIYQWARELAKTYAPVIGICQADGSAEGERWLHMGHVSNAKTAKQAEADFILGIGKSNEPGFDFVRYINICKNKLMGDDDTDSSRRHSRFEVLIKPEVARYEDIN